jgi:four helix bundle protein
MIQDSGFKNKNLNTKIKEFTDLKAWQESHKLVVQIYKITKDFPLKETYSLVDQMRRASASVSSNIAEGFGRQTYKEKVQFYYLSQGSLAELKNQLIIAKDVGYLKEKTFNELKTQADIAHQLLQGLITKSKTFINHKILNRESVI